MILIKKHEKVTTKFEHTDGTVVINKAYLEEEFLKIDGNLSFLEEGYNEFDLQNNKQSVEKILIQLPVKTTIQLLYDKGLFDNFQVADKV